MMGIYSDPSKLAKAFNAKATAMKANLTVAVKKATDVVFAESKSRLNQDIYNKKVPTKGEIQREKNVRTAKGEPGQWITTKSGQKIVVALSANAAKKAAWRRTGNLKGSEKRKMVSPYEGLIYNDAEYAQIRHEMGTDGNRPTRFPAHWHDEAVEATRDKVRMLLRDAVKSALSKN